MYTSIQVILHSGVCINKRYCRWPDIDQRYHMYSCIDIRYLVNSRVDRDHLHQCLCMLVKNSMYTGMYRYWSEISKTQLIANEYRCLVHICFDINQRYLLQKYYRYWSDINTKVCTYWLDIMYTVLKLPECIDIDITHTGSGIMIRYYVHRR